MKTTTYDYNSESFTVYEVPGNGLTINVEINAKMIKIIPHRQSEHSTVKGTRFTKSCRMEYYEFCPEDYKEFWKEFKKTSWYEDDCERMRKALTYALHKYQIKYGKIFA